MHKTEAVLMGNQPRGVVVGVLLGERMSKRGAVNEAVVGGQHKGTNTNSTLIHQRMGQLSTLATSVEARSNSGCGISAHPTTTHQRARSHPIVQCRGRVCVCVCVCGEGCGSV